MYYFGTNLENRFSVPDFWPSQEQSHRIPYEREEIREEVMRIARETREREVRRERVERQMREGLEEAKSGGGLERRRGAGEGNGGGEEKS